MRRIHIQANDKGTVLPAHIWSYEPRFTAAIILFLLHLIRYIEESLAGPLATDVACVRKTKKTLDCNVFLECPEFAEGCNVEDFASVNGTYKCRFRKWSNTFVDNLEADLGPELPGFPD